MAHKFAEIWHCFLLIGNNLQQKGIMDLRAMLPNGDLSTGDHEDPTGTHTRIVRGKAIGFGPIYRLTLENEFGDSYQGMLAHESADGGKFVIVGTKSYGSEERRLAETKDAAQDDPPWIITKP